MQRMGTFTDLFRWFKSGNEPANVQMGNQGARSSWTANVILPEDRLVHDWYRFVLSFPPHLVDAYLQKFGVEKGDTVLDPFCGTGTTLVECKKQGIPSAGIEANPLAAFAARVKCDWSPDPETLGKNAEQIAKRALRRLQEDGAPDKPGPTSKSRDLQKLPPEANELLLAKSISPTPLHKALVLLESIEDLGESHVKDHLRLAAAKAALLASNLRFGPEVGLGAVKKDAPLVGPWLDLVLSMAHDLRALRSSSHAVSEVREADARNLEGIIPQESVAAVFTSPPYPNEKDYTRTTRLESVLLGFLQTRQDLRAMKQALVRSNTRNVFRDDQDDRYVQDVPEIAELSEAIERRRVELGKTSGFERLYPRVTRLYFGGMTRHLAGMRHVLKPGARLGYVVGDQASYLRIMIRTGTLLAKIATNLGYEVEGLDLFRTRWATATSEQLREEVLVLRWPGG